MIIMIFFHVRGSGMDIRKLELLSDIAETGSLTESGKLHGYTQSGVSHTIKKLEEEFGFSLLHRTNKGVSLTSEAQQLLHDIRSLITRYHRLEETINSINGLQTGSLVIGTYSSIAIQWLPRIIPVFQTRYPGISLQIKEGGTEDLEKCVVDGTVDFAFLSSNRYQKFEFIWLAEDEMYAILPKNFPLKNKESHTFPLKSFQELPFIASEAGVDYDITDTLAAGDVTPPVRFYCKDDHSIIAMTAQGLGVTLLPSLIVSGYENQVLALPIEPYASRQLGIGLLSKNDLSAAARAFITCTKEVLGISQP